VHAWPARMDGHSPVSARAGRSLSGSSALWTRWLVAATRGQEISTCLWPSTLGRWTACGIRHVRSLIGDGRNAKAESVRGNLIDQGGMPTAIRSPNN